MVPLLLVNSSLLKIQCCKVCANDKALLKSVKYLYRSLINQYGHFVIEPNADQASFHLNACTVTRIHFEARGKSKMVYHKVSTSYLSPIIHVVFGSIVWREFIHSNITLSGFPRTSAFLLAAVSTEITKQPVPGTTTSPLLNGNLSSQFVAIKGRTLLQGN